MFTVLCRLSKWLQLAGVGVLLSACLPNADGWYLERVKWDMTRPLGDYVMLCIKSERGCSEIMPTARALTTQEDWARSVAISLNGTTATDPVIARFEKNMFVYFGKPDGLETGADGQPQLPPFRRAYDLLSTIVDGKSYLEARLINAETGVSLPLSRTVLWKDDGQLMVAAVDGQPPFKDAMNDERYKIPGALPPLDLNPAAYDFKVSTEFYFFAGSMPDLLLAKAKMLAFYKDDVAAAAGTAVEKGKQTVKEAGDFINPKLVLGNGEEYAPGDVLFVESPPNTYQRVEIVAVEADKVKVKLDDGSSAWFTKDLFFTKLMMEERQKAAADEAARIEAARTENCCCKVHSKNFWDIEMDSQQWMNSQQCQSTWTTYTTAGGGNQNTGSCQHYDQGSCKEIGTGDIVNDLIELKKEIDKANDSDQGSGSDQESSE